MNAEYFASQLSPIVSQLYSLFDEIGVPSHERDSQDSELLAALSETLNNQVRNVTAKRNEMTEEAQRIITVIKQMEASLGDVERVHDYMEEHEDLKVSYPLNKCLQILKEKHLQISKAHKERSEQIKTLVQALESYSSHLESSFVKIALPSLNASMPLTFDLSSSYVANLDNEFTRVYEEYTRRIATVKSLAESIIQLWAELGTPQAQTDATIVKYYRDSPEQLGLHEDDISRLRGKRDKLVEEKKARERRLKELKTTVEGLWNRLGVDDAERKRFLNSNRGCGIRQINEFEDELSKLNETKRKNLHIFVEEARYKLQELWDGLYFSEEEMLEFTPAFSDVYSDALLEAHEQEISRLETLREQRAPTLALIEKHRTLVKEQSDLAAASQDASRLMMRGQKGEKRDPTRLLREEKMRKRISKELPKVAADLRKILEDWEDEYGRPFLVHGERYLDELDASEARPPPGPRSKTPAGPPPAIKNQKPASSSRPNSVTRAPPPRTGAKTPTAMDTIRRNPVVNSTSTSNRTPSRIPARAPLSNLQHGNNSPERRARPQSRMEISRDDSSTIRKIGPLARAPPPKMRDLAIPSAPKPAEHYRSDSAESGAGVRHVSPEDVYDDRKLDQPNNNPSSVTLRDETFTQSYQHHQAPAPRQISNGSLATTTVSGSENWETYDDVSEPEQDVSETYYAKLRAVRGKRDNPYNGYAQQGIHPKRLRGIPPLAHSNHALVDGENRRIPSGSDSNWTDEDAYC